MFGTIGCTFSVQKKVWALRGDGWTSLKMKLKEYYRQLSNVSL